MAQMAGESLVMNRQRLPMGFALLLLLPVLLITGCPPGKTGSGSNKTGSGRKNIIQTSNHPEDHRGQSTSRLGRARMVSFGPERSTASCGGFLEPDWCVQLTAEVSYADGTPAVGVPVLFKLSPRSGRGTVIGAMLSSSSVQTDRKGMARVTLVSSDAEETCRVYASCAGMRLGAEVRFGHRPPLRLTVGSGVAPAKSVVSPGALELEIRFEQLVSQLAEGGRRAVAARKEILATGRAAIAPLLRLVFSSSIGDARRRQAARALALIRDELVLERLLAGLNHSSAAVRSGAETGLLERGVGRCGRDLHQLFKKSTAEGRASVLRIVCNWGRPKDRLLLIEACSKDVHPLVRATAAWKLKAFVAQKSVSAALLLALKDPSPFVRFSAAKALAMIPGRGGAGLAREVTSRALAESDPRVRAAAALACRGRENPAAIKEMLADSDVRVRRAATQVLIGFGKKFPDFLKRLRSLSRDRDPVMAAAAGQALVTHGNVRDAELMLKALRQAEPTRIVAALESLERIYLVSFERPLPVGNLSRKVVRRWEKWVKECRDVSKIDRWWLACRQKTSTLRGEAVLAMASSLEATDNDRRRAALLSAPMSRSQDPRVRAPSCVAAWLLGNQEAGRQLMIDISSKDWPSRYAACRAASRLQKRQVAMALARLLRDESELVRAAAYRSLLAIRGGDAAIGFRPAVDPASGNRQMQKVYSLWKRWAGAYTPAVRGNKGSGKAE
jgi:HEAT repeat protein